MLSAAQVPDCLATEPSWGSARPFASVMFAASPRTYTSGRPGAVRSGSTSTRPPRPVVRPAGSSKPEALSPAVQMTMAAGNSVPSSSATPLVETEETALPRWILTPSSSRLRRVYFCERSENGGRTVSTMSTRCTSHCAEANSSE